MIWTDIFIPETISSLVLSLLICTLAFITYFLSKKVDPLKQPKGWMALAEIAVSTIDSGIKSYMGRSYQHLGGFFLTLMFYTAGGFLISLFGFSTPLLYYMNTFIIVLYVFILIHFTAIKNNKWAYFKRFIEPFPVFLPINLVSMWSPLVSMSFRIFGNALAGFAIMSLLYFSLGQLSSVIFSFLPAGLNSIFIAPLVTPWLHLYFDLFGALIQTLVFISLSMIFIAQEGPKEAPVSETEPVSNNTEIH